MNCGTDATNSLLLPMTTNETLFTDNYTKTPTNTPSPFRLCQYITNMLCYVTWRTEWKNWHSVRRGLRCPSALQDIIILCSLFISLENSMAEKKLN